MRKTHTVLRSYVRSKYVSHVTYYLGRPFVTVARNFTITRNISCWRIKARNERLHATKVHTLTRVVSYIYIYGDVECTCVAHWSRT